MTGVKRGADGMIKDSTAMTEYSPGHFQLIVRTRFLGVARHQICAENAPEKAIYCL